MALIADLQDQIHETIAQLVLDHGRQRLDWLTMRTRRAMGDPDVDRDEILAVVGSSTVLVARPSGHVDHALAVLEGNILTHRVRSSLAGRTELWLGPGLQPLLNVATYRPIPLADGSGEVTRAGTGHDVLVGPPGWLPEVERWGLVGLRVVDQALHVVPVAESELPSPADQLRVRRFLGDLYTRRRYWHGDDGSLAARPEELARTLNLALLEAPDLFASPYPPLDELLHDPLQRNADLDIFRELATSQQLETATLYLDGIPRALEVELAGRARQYGMPVNQFIVALLSMLAWRTPFAEDMEPWENWDPDHRPAAVRTLRSVDDWED
jgi:hypothetical protein